MYGIDKYRAIKNKWRISEKTLLTLGLLGGFVGALLGIYIFNHKKNKYIFWVVNIFMLILFMYLVIGG